MAVKVNVAHATDQERAQAVLRRLYAATRAPGARNGSWRKVGAFLGVNAGSLAAYAKGGRHIPNSVLLKLGVRKRAPKMLWQMGRHEIAQAILNRRCVNE